MSRNQFKISNLLPPPLTALPSRLHALVNRSQAFFLLSGLVLMACGPLNTSAQDAANEDAPFSTAEVPLDAPVHHVSVKFPLDWEPRILAAREYKGLLVYEDSILGKVGEVPEATETVHAQSLPKGSSWQNKTITYSMSGAITQSLAKVIRDAARHYNEKTVVRWEEAAGGSGGMVKFILDDAMSSSGRTHLDTEHGVIVGASIRLKSKATDSTVRHEMLHALGFDHEQKRPDRNTYLQVTIPTDPTESSSSIEANSHPIGHYDLVSKVHYDYATGSNPDFQFSLRDDARVRTLFQKEVRRYNGLSADPATDEKTVRKYVGEGDQLSYLDIYALRLKYTVSNTARPFTVTATEETDPAVIAQAGMSRGQKLFRLSIKNNSGFDAESWALRVQFGGTALPAGLAPVGEQSNGFLTPNVPYKETSGTQRRTEILTPMEGNSRITQGKTPNAYVVMNPGARGRLEGITFCRLNSFDCLSTGS